MKNQLLDYASAADEGVTGVAGVTGDPGQPGHVGQVGQAGQAGMVGASSLGPMPVNVTRTRCDMNNPPNDTDGI